MSSAPKRRAPQREEGSAEALSPAGTAGVGTSVALGPISSRRARELFAAVQVAFEAKQGRKMQGDDFEAVGAVYAEVARLCRVRALARRGRG